MRMRVQFSCGTGAADFDHNSVRPSPPVLIGSTWCMFYWGANTTALQDKIGVATAPAITGPWTRKGILFEPFAPLVRVASASNVGPEASAPIWDGTTLRLWFSGKTEGGSYNTYLARISSSYLTRNFG